MFDFRLTSLWHAPRIAFGPALIAPISSAVSRSPMAAAPERTERHEKVERAEHVEDIKPDKERLKAVELAFGQIEKQFGKGAIMRLGGKEGVAPIPSISTGSISLDW